METVLITGSSGGIGRVLVPFLCARGYGVIGLDLKAPDFSMTKIENFEFIQGSILEPEKSIREAAKFVNHVVHLAAISSLPECEASPHEAFENNFIGTVKLVGFLTKFEIRSFINASTSAIYEGIQTIPFTEEILCNPRLIYPQTKLMAENFLASQYLTRNFPSLSLRFFNVIGPFQDYSRISPPLVNYIIREYLRGKQPVLHSDGLQERDYISVYDICSAIYAALKTLPQGSPIFNVCSGETLSVREIDKLVRTHLRIDSEPIYRNSEKLWDDYPVLFSGAHPLNREMVARETTKKSIGSSALFQKTCNWKIAYPIREVIGEICDDAVSNMLGEKI